MNPGISWLLVIRLVVLSEPQVIDLAKQQGLLRLDCDVLVVGTGAGGAPVAATMAKSGARVLMVEAGGYYQAPEFHSDPLQAFRTLYEDHGLAVTLGRPSIPLPYGRCVGGSTTINSGTVFRTPDSVLQKWSDKFGISGVDPKDLAPWLDEAFIRIGAAPAQWDALGKANHYLATGIQRLGWSGGPLTRNAPTCAGCGVCTFGCPINAKRSSLVTWVPDALSAGARMLIHAKVTDLNTQRGRVVSVSGTGPSSATFTVRADQVVLSAGALGTPDLLMRNQVGGGYGLLGENLSLHPAVGAMGITPWELQGWNGIPQGYMVDEWFASDHIMLEGGFVPPQIFSWQLPEIGTALREAMQAYSRMIVFGGMVGDHGTGKVRPLPGGGKIIRYRVTDDVARKLAFVALRTAEIYFAAGVEKVRLPFFNASWITRLAELKAIRPESIPAAAMDITAFHPMGTARMGRDPRQGVTDSHGKLWKFDNLYVADASLFPTSLAVNPQLTVMAFGLRLANHLLHRSA